MTALLIALNILAGLFLIGVVLLQSGKGAEMGAAFGGAGSTVFGPSAPGNALTKITAATAAVFMLSSLGLAILSGQSRSVFEGTAEPEPLTAPVAAPGAVPPVAETEAAAGDAAAAAPTAGIPDVAEPGAGSLEDAVRKAAQQGQAAGDAAGAAAADTQAAAEQAAAVAGDAAEQAADTAKGAPAATEQAAQDAGDTVKDAAPADVVPPGPEGSAGDDADPAQQPVDRMAAGE